MEDIIIEVAECTLRSEPHNMSVNGWEEMHGTGNPQSHVGALRNIVSQRTPVEKPSLAAGGIFIKRRSPRP